MVLTSSGEVLTNNHVIRGATDIKVQCRAPARATGRGRRLRRLRRRRRPAGEQRRGSEDVSLGDSSSVDSGESVWRRQRRRHRPAHHRPGHGHQPRPLDHGERRPGRQREPERADRDERGRAARRLRRAALERGRPGDRHGHRRVRQQRRSPRRHRQPRLRDPDRQGAPIVEQIHSGNGSETIHIGGTAFLGVEASYGQLRRFGRRHLGGRTGQPGRVRRPRPRRPDHLVRRPHDLLPGRLSAIVRPRSPATRSP